MTGVQAESDVDVDTTPGLTSGPCAVLMVSGAVVDIQSSRLFPSWPPRPEIKAGSRRFPTLAFCIPV